MLDHKSDSLTQKDVVSTETSELSSQLTPQLSIVMPCFNEAEGIETRVLSWMRFAQESAANYEIVLINDGSSDGTGRILDKLRKEHKGLRTLHQLNGGHARAIRRGYELARGTYVLQVDSNGLYQPEDFVPFWEKRHLYELVLGYRTAWVEGGTRRFLLSAVRGWVRFLFGFRLRDPNVPFRLFRREIAQSYLEALSPDFEGVNLALSILFQRDYPQGVCELPLPDRARTTPPTRIVFRHFFFLVMHYLLEISQLRFSKGLRKPSSAALPPPVEA